MHTSKERIPPSDAAEFIRDLAAALGLNELSLASRLTDDLGLDSLDYLEVLELLNDWGAPVSSEILTDAITVGDLVIEFERAIAEAGAVVPTAVAKGASPLQFAPESGLESGRVRLRPLMRRDYDALHLIACDPETGRRWRFGGTTPSVERFIRSLTEDVMTQYVIEDVASGELLGLVQAYRASMHGHAHLSSLIQRHRMGSGLATEALAIFINHLFKTFNFRYLFAEVPEYNLRLLYREGAVAPTPWQEYGRMPEFEYAAERYWDLCILGISRQKWERDLRSRIEQVVLHPRLPPTVATSRTAEP